MIITPSASVLMLHLLRQARASYSLIEVGATESITFRRNERSMLFISLSGSGFAQVGKAGLVRIPDRGFVFVPRAEDVTLAVTERPSAAVVRKQFPRSHGRHFTLFTTRSAKRKSVVIFAEFSFESVAVINLIELLPAVVEGNSSSFLQESWLKDTMELLSRDCPKLRSELEHFLPQFADMILIECVRAWLEHHPDIRDRWISTSQDRQIGSAIALLQDYPERDWTINSLASYVAMSRSAFAKRFKEITGESPIEYLTKYRMSQAERMLRDGEGSINQVAVRSGYSSESSFSRAFLREIGISPSSVRRKKRRSLMTTD